MRAEAESNCRERSLAHVEVVASDDGLTAVQGAFDFVHTCQTLQHIDPTRSERIVGRLAPGGVAVLHLPIGDRHSRAFATAFWLKDRVPGLYGVINLARGRRWSHPSMQMHCHNLNRLLATAVSLGVRDALVQPFDDCGYLCTEIFLQRPRG